MSVLGWMKAMVAEAKYRGIDDPHFLDGDLAETKDGKSARISLKEARNIAYTTLYSAPVVPSSDIADTE